MVQFEVNGANGHKVLTYPTNLKELTSEFLSKVAEEIVPAPNYSLIALCYRERLHNIIFTANQKSDNANLQTAVIPIFVKTGNKPEDKFIANIGDKVVIAGSQLALGHHVMAAKNPLTINNLLWYTKGDAAAYHNALNVKDYVYFLEFKLIPNNDIVGVYVDCPSSNFTNVFDVLDAEPTGDSH